MPRKGNKSITVSEQVFKRAAEKAEKLNKSISGLVSELILSDCPEVEAKSTGGSSS